MKALEQLVDPVKTAIIVVDVQNDFCEPEGACGKAGADTSSALAMVPRLQRLIEAGREFGVKPIFIQTIHEDCTDSEAWLGRHGDKPRPICRKDTWGAEFTGVEPIGGEPVVNKHRYSAFINTRLDSVLRTYKIENLIMTGVSTNVCVESTARQAYMMDYNIVFLSDCTAAYSPAEHEGALNNIRRSFGVVATSDDVRSIWMQKHSIVMALP